MNLIKYSIILKKYLHELDNIVRLYLKHTYPEPKTHEFIVISKYNQIIDSIVEEFVRGEIMKIV